MCCIVIVMGGEHPMRLCPYIELQREHVFIFVMMVERNTISLVLVVCPLDVGIYWPYIQGLRAHS